MTVTELRTRLEQIEAEGLGAQTITLVVDNHGSELYEVTYGANAIELMGE